MRAWLLLPHEIEILRMQRDAVDLAGDESGQPPGGALRDELGVVDREPAGAQRGAADQPVEAANATGGGKPPAFEAVRRLDLGRPHGVLPRSPVCTPSRSPP